MKRIFLVKGARREIRIAEKYIKLYDAMWMWHSENDFAILEFNNRKEEEQAFEGIAEYRGEYPTDFYKDTETGVSYVRMQSKDETVETWRYVASCFNYTGYEHVS